MCAVDPTPIYCCAETPDDEHPFLLQTDLIVGEQHLEILALLTQDKITQSKQALATTEKRIARTKQKKKKLAAEQKKRQSLIKKGGSAAKPVVSVCHGEVWPGWWATALHRRVSFASCGGRHLPNMH